MDVMSVIVQSLLVEHVLQLGCSACEEKYLRELSVTPVGYYFTGANTPVGLGYHTGTILQRENEVFQSRDQSS
jgi:hypothetical protein